MSCVCHSFASIHCCTVVFGILGQVWYLVVSMTDSCCLSYFDWMAAIQILKAYTIKKLQRDLANMFCNILSKAKGFIRTYNVIVFLIEVDRQLSCHIKPDMKIPESKESFDKRNTYSKVKG